MMNFIYLYIQISIQLVMNVIDFVGHWLDGVFEARKRLALKSSAIYQGRTFDVWGRERIQQPTFAKPAWSM